MRGTKIQSFQVALKAPLVGPFSYCCGGELKWSRLRRPNAGAIAIPMSKRPWP